MIRSEDSSGKRSLLFWCREGGIVGLVLLAAMQYAYPSDGTGIEPLWTANPDMIMEGPPMVVDLNADGDTEVITAAYEHMIAVDGSGEELWRFDTRGRYSTCPAVLEREGDLPLIYAGDNSGMFTCLDGMGEVVWQKEVGHIFCSAPALADLNSDGVVEVIQGDHSGRILALHALTGEIVWEAQIEGVCSSPAVADLNGDGLLEVVCATGNGNVVAVNAAREVIWEFNMNATAPFWAIASPVVFASSNGDVRIAAASQAGEVFCLDSMGSVLWERPVRGPVASTISVGDLDADGRADIFAVTELGVLYQFDEQGRIVWNIDTQGRSLAPGAVIDINGDGSLEYVLCTQRGHLMVFGRTGDVVFDHQFDNRTINMTASFGDVVRDRAGLEFAVTGGESGQIFCFGTEAPVDALSHWRTYRGNDRLTGAWFGLVSSDKVRMIPENLNWNEILTGEDITFRIKRPLPDDNPLNAEVSCLRPDGSRQVAVGKIVGSTGILKLSAEITAPGVYQFEWRVKDGSNTVLLNDSRELTLQPFQNDQALARRAILALQETVGEVRPANADTGFTAAILQESLAIEKETTALAELQAAAPGSPARFWKELTARVAALNIRAKRALSLAKVSPSIESAVSDIQVVAFDGTTWENRDVDSQVPTDASTPLTVHRRCVVGEHEPISVKLLNVTLDAVTVSASLEQEEDAPAVTLCEVKAAPTNQQTTAWDPIVPLGTEKVVIPPLATREFWLDVDVSRARAGSHNFAVRFDTGTTTTRAEVDLEVLPFEMAEPGAIRLCCWSSYNEDAVQDLLAHGNNVFTVGLPPATVAENDPPDISIDTTVLDAFVAPLAGHNVFLLMGGIPSLGVPMESDDYGRRLATYLDLLMTHLASRGIDEDHVALYPHDEPGGHGWETVHHYVAFGRKAREARPGLRLYVNGGGDLAMFEALNEVASIWCPGFYMIAEDSPEMNFLRNSGKTIWTYDCGYSFARPIGANTKTINVVAQYRMAAVFAHSFGASGLGYWCYNVGPSMWDPIDQEYPLVYTNPDGTHTTSRRWEAVREGIEDARILIGLQQKLSDASVCPEAKERIRVLLEQTVPAVSKQALSEVHLGVARYVIDDSNNDAAVNMLRNEMMNCVDLLTQTPR